MTHWEEVVGVVHAHSRHSDGISTTRRIARAANRAQLDFLVMTDHDTLAGLHAGEEGRYGNTLVIIGQEVSPDDGHHFLALDLDEVIAKDGGPARYVPEVAERGGIGFIAHPDYPSPDRYPLKTFPWTDWDVEGYTGIEIWSYTVDWLTDVTTIGQALQAVLFPDRYVAGPFPETLARWDNLCQEAWHRGRRVVGLGAADAHGILYSYRRMFQALRMHLLVEPGWGGRGEEDELRDKQRVHDALREGRGYVAYDGLHDGSGFRFVGRRGDEGSGPAIAVMGSTLSLGGDAGGSAADVAVELRAEAPRSCRMSLIHNGKMLVQTESDVFEQRVRKPGVYRVEAHLPSERGWRPWLFTNPIYIR